ncbi:MAG: CHAT domain-containing protein [Acidobacteria bacterium]|nr:CHAT domain-containing protein [Acidobacteriota bacterium]
MLKTSSHSGFRVLEHYNFSYLPSVYGNAKQEPSSPSAPILIRPNSSLDLPEIQAEETFFKTLFPDLQVSEQLEGQFPPGARWVHISTHFRLDQRFWLASGFANGPEELNIFRFLQHPLSCTLLSLGVCDAGNAYTSDSPYWLGFSELFLNTGVQALLVNRWRLDEIASRIYRDFYVLSRQGLPMDQAITQARLRFMSQTFRRGTAKVTGQHPFFWAGVTYVGVPGRTLYPKPQWEGGLLLWGVSLGTLLVFTFGVLALSTRRRR